MPKGRWLILIAIGGLATLFAASALGDITCEIVGGSSNCQVSGGNREGRSESEDQDSKRSASDRRIGVDAEQSAASPDDIAECDDCAESQKANDLAERDLFAQEAMALAAWVAVVLTGVGISLLYATLRATAAATKAAARAAIAAEDGLKAARQSITVARQGVAAAQAGAHETKRIGEATARAYLAVTDVFLDNPPLMEFEFRASVVNTGQSPARQVTLKYEIELFFIPINALPGAGLEREFTPEKLVRVRNIAATLSDSVMLKTDNPSNVVFETFERGSTGIRVEIRGTIQWVDVFDRRQTQRFEFFHFALTEQNLAGGQPIRIFPGTYSDWAAGKSQV